MKYLTNNLKNRCKLCTDKYTCWREIKIDLNEWRDMTCS